jgi:hypothetical protein
MKKIISSCLLGILLVSSTLATRANAETHAQRAYRRHHHQVVIHHPGHYNRRVRQVRHNRRVRQVHHHIRSHQLRHHIRSHQVRHRIRRDKRHELHR